MNSDLTQSRADTAVTHGDSFAAEQTAQDARASRRTRRFRLWRGDASGGDFRDYETEVV